MLKAIVFDFDGVIADSEPLHYEAFRAIAASFGLRFDYETYIETYIGYDDRDAFKVMLKQAKDQGTLPAKVPDIPTLCARKEEVFAAVVNRGIRGYPGVPELIKAAANAKLPIAISSGATRHDIDLILKKFGLTKHFPIIVTADDVAKSKPDPESYAKAADALIAAHDSVTDRSECLAIEDTQAGLASAKAAGLMTLAVLTTSPANDLRKADRVIEKLEGVTIDQLREWYA